MNGLENTFLAKNQLAPSPASDRRLVDVHTHQNVVEPSVIAIRNIIVGHDTIQPEQVVACSVGIHPWYLNDIENQFEQLRQWADLPTVWAIGECGLDRLTDAPFEQQEAIFERQIQLAEVVRKPMIIHCVRAMAEVAALRKKHQPQQPWVMHGFNNRLTLLEPLLATDFYISLGAALLRTGSPAQKALSHIPLNRLLLETDDKVVSIHAIYEAAATLLSLSLDDLTKAIRANAQAVFQACS